jgi:hypothetical protein
LNTFKNSSESADTQLRNAEMQKYPAYWVAALTFAAQESGMPKEFLAQYISDHTHEETGMEYSAKVAQAILDES